MTYAGLTTADKGALLDAKANGFKLLCETRFPISKVASNSIALAALIPFKEVRVL